MKNLIYRAYLFPLIVLSGCASMPSNQPAQPAYQDTPAINRHIEAGVQQYNFSQYDAAINHFESALALEPIHPIALFELALTFMALNRHDDCIATAEKGLIIQSDFEAKLTSLSATCHSRAGNINKAIKLYRSSLRTSPNDYATHYNIAVAYGKLKNDEKAIYHFQQSIDNNTEYASPYFALGEIYLSNNRRAAALFYYMKFGLMERNTDRAKTAAARIALLPYNGLNTKSKQITVNLDSNHQGDENLLSLDLGLQIAAAAIVANDSKVSSKEHEQVLSSFVQLTKEMVENNPEMKKTATWRYAIADILAFHSRDELDPLIEYLANTDGFERSI